MHTQKRLLGFMLRIGAALAISIVASPAISAPIEWVTVGSPNATKDDTGFGAVGYEFQMAKYETTNAQYVEFLNAVADKEDVHGLYSASMTSSVHGGIARQGALGSYSYSLKAGMDNNPVNYVTFYDTLRFANWLNNGKGAGDTETGAYTLAGGNPVGVVRNAGANIFLPSEDEWYKAAYYDAASGSFFDYAAGSDTPITCASPGGSPNGASCHGSLRDVGSYTASASSYGTFDQDGNVWELLEATGSGASRIMRGGGWVNAVSYLGSGTRANWNTSSAGEHAAVGFRMAYVVPEPSTAMLMMLGLAGVGGWRRVHGG
jgi:formylglycine-generating enzyme